VASDRPSAVQWAVVIAVINAVGGAIFSAAWPDLDDRGTVITVSTVAGLLMLAAAYFLWNGNRWGAIATIALNVLNILAGIPAFFDTSTDGFVVGAATSIVLSLAIIALVMMPVSRAFWNRERAVIAAS
jgi:hypothetical protein